MHVWIIEVRDRDTSKPGGWSAWKPLAGCVYHVRCDAVSQCRDLTATRSPGDMQYRVRRYDRREG